MQLPKILRRKKRDTVDNKLDDALKRLSDATEANDEACEQVKLRQTNGKLKIVSVPPGKK